MFAKKLLTGVFSLMFIFSTSINPLNVQAEENYALQAQQLDKIAYEGDDLGAVYTKDSTTFKVWAPTASTVLLNLYSTGSDDEDGAEKLSQTVMDYDTENGVWSVTAQGDLNGVYYTYSVTVNNEENETVDIYAKAVGVNGNRGMVIDLETTNPDNWDNDKYVLQDNPTDAIVWEVHIGDFSQQQESGIKDEYRGRYLAFTQDGTTLVGNEAIPTGISYLKSLGVTHVQINPFYDFGSIDETKASSKDYNWGYDPKNYNVPEGSYSTDPYNGQVRITEAKQMIQALHNAGIGVIMDVVYNHTYTLEDSFFNMTVPNYYHRFNDDGTPSNGSGCGNDTASEHEMYRKFMIESIHYWAEEYHIDGFRFDLMGLHDVDTMNAIRDDLDTIDSRILMYGEAWNLSTNTQAKMANQDNERFLSDRIAAFNDGMRDAVKGNNFEATGKGFVQGGGSRIGVKNGIKAATNTWSGSPNQAVTYTSCHDNFTLYDKLVASMIGLDGSYRQRNEQLVAMNKLAGATILTSQGMSFMLAGEEMARSKDGDHNSFISSKELNQIDWTNVSTFGDLTAYYTGLIQLRKAYSPFRDATKTTVDSMNFFENTDNKVLAYSMENKLAGEDEWSKVICIYNSDTESSKDVTLEGDNLSEKWIVVANDQKAGVLPIGQVSGNVVTVPKTSVMILVDKDSFDKASVRSDEKTTEFKKTLTQSITKPTEKDNITATVTKDDTGTRDTGNPLVPLIIAGVIVGGIAVSMLIYKKFGRKK